MKIADSFTDMGESANAGRDSAVFSPEEGEYAISYCRDGVYLETYWKACEPEARLPYILFDLERRDVQGCHTDEIKRHLSPTSAHIKIADAQVEKDCDSDVAVYVDSSEMSAYMMLFPAAGKGNEKNADEILQKIRQKWKIEKGLNEQKVRDSVEKKLYCRSSLIAVGLEPVQGKDGRIQFHFKMEHDGTPVLLDDGTVDYKNLDLFNRVLKGEVIATRVPPEDGTDGYAVTGKVLAGKKGREAVMPRGANTELSSDGAHLIASVDGSVDYTGGRVEVSNIYEVKGDADMSVGNLSFGGDIVIRGNVISNLCIEAKGNIEVYGSVGASVLIAEKNIVIRNGAQGADKGRLKAGGSVTARFLERIGVEAHGSVCADYIVHCMVSAADSVTMKGKRGKIIGGTVRAGKAVSARFIGSPAGEQTLIEVGMDPELRTALNDLKQEKQQVRTQMDKIEYVTRLLPAAKNDSAERLATRQKLLENHEQCVRRLSQLSAEIEDIEGRMAELKEGKVLVSDTAYRGVKITINACTVTLETFAEHVTYRYSDGQVLQSSYR